uniref:Uncharacterized protein n=1 Tax=viral metagenome TaxID=1070528 RepID=A0A6C0DRY8_9ZZZZ
MSASNVSYPDLASWKAAVKQWLMDLQALGPTYGWFASTYELSVFATELARRDLQNTSAFDGIKLITEFYSLVKVHPEPPSRLPPEIKRLWSRIEPIFKSGVRLGKTMMNKASGPNFAGTGLPISHSYIGNAAAWNMARLPQPAPRGPAYGIPWAWNGGPDPRNGGTRRRRRKNRSTRRR